MNRVLRIALRPQGGNMYNWLTHTLNIVTGKCPHECVYCYMRKYRLGPLRLREGVFQENLGDGMFIFVGSSTDMFADQVPAEWIERILKYCGRYDNGYLFQTKNPWRFHEFLDQFPERTILGITLESNIERDLSKAPLLFQRMIHFSMINRFPRMVSIEPIMDFDFNIFSAWIRALEPEFVSIGADSKGHNLPEPSRIKVEALIRELGKFTEVRIKNNLLSRYALSEKPNLKERPQETIEKRGS